MPHFVLSRGARDDLEKLSPDVKERILAKLDQYRRLPDPLVVAKRLRSDPEGTLRFRVGDWRVKFILEGDKLLITRIQHRRDVYRT